MLDAKKKTRVPLSRRIVDGEAAGAGGGDGIVTSLPSAIENRGRGWEGQAE
jgi:hypothetical protein